MGLWLLLLVPVVFAIGSKLIWKHKVTLLEVVAHIGIVSVVIATMYFIALFTSLSDTNYVHGYVTKKEQVEVSCEHSYQCNCYTSCSGSGSSRSCSRHCSTCYEHWHDYDWRVFSTVGWDNIPRIDRQGTREPPEFTAVYMGEPFTASRSFSNYVKNSANSLFHRASNIQWVDYPRIYDTYKFTQVIMDGVQLSSDFNKWMREKSAHSSKASNVLLVFAPDSSDKNKYVETAKGAWAGAKINDVVVVVGVSPELVSATWVKAFTYGNDKDNELLVVKIRDSLEGMSLTNPEQFVNTLFDNVERYYTQVKDTDFEYLKNEIELTPTGFMILAVLVLLINIGTSYFFITNTEEEWNPDNYKWRKW